MEPISSNEQQARMLNIYAVLDVVLHLCSFPQTVGSINNTNILLPFTSTNHRITSSNLVSKLEDKIWNREPGLEATFPLQKAANPLPAKPAFLPPFPCVL